KRQKATQWRTAWMAAMVWANLKRRQTVRFIIFSLTVFTVCLPSSTSADSVLERSIDNQGLHEILKGVREKHDLPALAAAVVRSQGTIAVAAVGVRKRGADIPVTTDDQFHLGSDTKPITAFLIAWLIEHGKLDWETPLVKLFPE